ncbi:SGNH/GDSL hydrolase family protein [Candidatus Omnitrophota bacterium]
MQRIGLITFGLLLSLLLLEIGLRINGILYLSLYSHPNVKNADFVILSIGDSTTFGFAVPPQSDYSSLLENMLNDHSDSTKFRVINCGIPGQTSTSILRYIDHQMIRYKPDLVIALFGINDFNEQLNKVAAIKHGLFGAITNLRIYKLYTLCLDFSIPKLKMTKNGMVAFDQNKETGQIKPQYVHQLQYNYTRIISRIRDKYQSNIIILQYIAPSSDKTNSIIKKISRENNAICVNTGELSRRKDLISKDGFHPNKRGHILIARRLFDVLTDKDLVPLE